jgi:hypothetical protein
MYRLNRCIVLLALAGPTAQLAAAQTAGQAKVQT